LHTGGINFGTKARLLGCCAAAKDGGSGTCGVRWRGGMRLGEEVGRRGRLRLTCEDVMTGV